MRIVNNHIHSNGQIGLVGNGDNIQIVDNILAHNNYAGFSTTWEAGGAKLVKTTNCIAPGSLDTSLSHAAGLSDIAVCHA